MTSSVTQAAGRSSTAAHTPLPWSLLGSDNATPHIMAREARSIEDRENLICWMPAEITQNFNSWENARFIVRACNSHYELMEALRNLIEFAQGEYDHVNHLKWAADYPPPAPAEITAAQSALSKAEGKQ